MRWKQDCLVLLGALVGGALGYAGFFWLAGQGFYGLVLPGGLLGCGAGLFQSRSGYLGVVCGVLALGLGLFAEWRFAPFVADGSFGFFLAHWRQLKPITLVMIAVGTLIGFGIPFSRSRDAAAADRRASAGAA
ncbi:hypothetical protein Pla175_31830 [Pirellulimonas nuda]|uniref:Uncharacterized protein n=1 Tax=Pirellulimonas nuda TaxID=2528009 RepID=A0A518DE78_9BACT|nr:hypothetical protein [Pirellulimonas nuda]QDU89788.1 hypothetical protein Pla175_31830 [Pirellulimonas nuda]